MNTVDRRSFGKLVAGAGALAAAPFGLGAFAIAQGAAKIVIVGGGPGGATVAHFIKKEAPQLDITLVEVRPTYTTCFFSNLYLGGFRSYESLQHGYDGLRRLGIKVVTGVATDVDTAKKAVKLRDGRMLPYDKLVLSPGIDFKFDRIKGYTAEAIEAMPHAYKPGTQVIERSYSVDLARWLVAEGRRVTGWDPMAMDEVRAVLSNQIAFADGPAAVLKACDVTVVAMPLPELAEIDWTVAGDRVVVDCWRCVPEGARARLKNYQALGHGDETPLGPWIADTLGNRFDVLCN